MSLSPPPRGAPQPQGPGRAGMDLAAGERLEGARQLFQDRQATGSCRRRTWGCSAGHYRGPLLVPPSPFLGTIFDVSHRVAGLHVSA
jgi:hypothetical protein